MNRILFICGFWLAFVFASFAETLPPKPAHYFNDFAHVVPTQAAAALEEKLQQFERDTSNQIVVAVFPKMETNSSIEDYTYRIAESWGVGQKDKRNGAVLFVFIADHKMFIQVGYGLEGALPDAICKRIVAEQIAPPFKSGNYEAGLISGVDSMIQATRGEYRGTGKLSTDVNPRHGAGGTLLVIGFFVLFFILQVFLSSRRGAVYGGSGRGFATGLLWGILGSMGGGGSSGGGGRGNGGGGFSGGGGSFGGGGAGGNW